MEKQPVHIRKKQLSVSLLPCRLARRMGSLPDPRISGVNHDLLKCNVAPQTITGTVPSNVPHALCKRRGGGGRQAEFEKIGLKTASPVLQGNDGL